MGNTFSAKVQVWCILVTFFVTNERNVSAWTCGSSRISMRKNVQFIRDSDHVVRSTMALYAVKSQMYSKRKPIGKIGHDEYDDEECDLVLDDFDEIVEAIRIFKSVTGDFDIPAKFEVPNQNPWPSNLAGLRLGKRLEKILKTEDFFTKHAGKVDKLSQTGFNPSSDSLVDDWRIIHDALKVYKTIYGNLRVASKFEVPDDEPWPRYCRTVKLGVRVAAIRSAGRYVKDHPDRKEDLDKLGFEWRLRDNTHKQQVNEEHFEQVMMALTAYKQLVGADLVNVPLDFVVPAAEPWPEATHGMKLGEQVKAIRDKDKLVYGNPEREKRLTELGFDSEAEGGRSVYSKKRFEIVYAALQAYKAIFNDLTVPQAFTVPEDDPRWPEEAYGLKLGARVNAIRCQGTLVSNSPERRDMLDKLGFSWELPSYKKKKKAEAAEEEGADAVSTTDSVMTALGLKRSTPEGATDETAAVKQRIANMPNMPSGGLSGSFGDDQRPVLDYDPSRMFEPLQYREIAAETVREYMQGREYSEDPEVRRFAHFEGHLTPQDYHRVISRGIPEEDIKAMKKIGYRIFEFGRFNWDNIVTGLNIYKGLYGHVDVPPDFVVDEHVIAQGGREGDGSEGSGSAGFDERFEGMRLGEAVVGLRIGDIDGMEDNARRKTLEALGFVWGDKTVYQRFRFVPMFMGLKLYKHLYGFPMPLTNFVVPDEPQWPYWMINMPLGEWSAVARVQQKMIEEHYPERRDLLNSLEYVWWLPPGNLPSKYYRTVK